MCTVKDSHVVEGFLGLSGAELLNSWWDLPQQVGNGDGELSSLPLSAEVSGHGLESQQRRAGRKGG